MNTAEKAAFWCVAALIALLVMILTLVLGLVGSESEKQASFSRNHVAGQFDLNRGAVPGWAVQPLLDAAKTCPQITAPILAAQLDTESTWDPRAYNEDSQATGLAQFLPATWTDFGTDGDVPPDGKADPYDPEDAIKSQAIYMCYLVDFVQKTPGLSGELVDLALASYNAGPGNVQEYGGIPPFVETTMYVTKIRNLANTKYANVASIPADSSGRAGPVIQKAAEHVDKTWYSWGGGTLNGPSAGTDQGQGVTGFDCSSLVRYAYHQGTGQAITLPRTANEQYQATQSQPVAVANLQPGDLLFWGKGRKHHVALYVGNGRIIEAPDTGKKVTETKIRTGGDYAGATRVFGGPLDVGSHV